MGCGRNGPPEMTEDQKIILAEIEKISRTMDVKFMKICGWDFGLDAVIGLFPGIGDMVTAAISFWIVMRTFFAFDPWIFRCKWFPLLLNVAIDLCIGIVPIFGDIFGK